MSWLDHWRDTLKLIKSLANPFSAELLFSFICIALGDTFQQHSLYLMACITYPTKSPLFSLLSTRSAVFLTCYSLYGM